MIHPIPVSPNKIKENSNENDELESKINRTK